MTKKIPHLVHQGDVLLIEATLSTRAEPIAMTKTVTGQTETVLALGETSGHRHTIISDRIARFRDDGAGYGPRAEFVTLNEPAPIQHLHGTAPTGEHADIALNATTYLVELQSQWSDAMEPIQVVD
ncbi:hypothetical protein [Gluconacetobacter asukensis]|uniref:Uncharacterized protein n=1 Tax=Gluconacetobacter asukensis TaxID=1017181 RepID=A0A7W4J1P2_9PROT|nr:hypothetical protein [Gluconacetobacter asukensis]MBB2172847.1 hypothetical protein [Gluconacetobacter asukensis]